MRNGVAQVATLRVPHITSINFERLRREQRRASDLFAFKANFRHAAIEPDLLPVLSFAGGYGGMVVADDGVATLAGCIREDRLGRIRRGFLADFTLLAHNPLTTDTDAIAAIPVLGTVVDGRTWLA